MNDFPDLDPGYLPPHPVDPPEIHLEGSEDVDPWGALPGACPAATPDDTEDDVRRAAGGGAGR